MRVVVIGGGIAGLSACHYLINSQEPVDVTLVEASAKLGGVISSSQFQGAVIEHGPDAIITAKPWGLALIKELGLEGEVIGTNEQYRRAFVAFKGKLHPIPPGFFMMAPGEVLPLLTSGLFTPLGKMRMLMDLLIERRRPSGDDKPDDESVASFVRRRLGQQVLERVAQPLLAGIYTADPEKLSLRSTMPQFLDFEQRYGSVIVGVQEQSKQRSQQGTEGGARYSMFITLRRGMYTLVDALIKRIGAKNIKLNSSVIALQRQGQGWLVSLKEGQTLEADGIVLATPSHVSADLLKPLDKPLSSEMSKIRRASSAVLNLVYKQADIKHPLDGFGFVVPAIEKRSLIACSFSSTKFAHRAPSGMVSLRVFLGGAMQPEVYCLDETSMQERSIKDISAYIGIKGEPLFASLQRWPDSMPQYDVNHHLVLAQIEKKVEQFQGIALAGNISGVGIPDCIHSGQLAAQKLLNWLNANLAVKV